jgi:hypothetical protein
MAVIGTVEVDVIPSTKQFVNKLRGGIMPQADQVGRQWGERFGAAAGDDARKRIELALGRLKDVNVGVDTKGAETKVAALRTQIDSLDKSNTKVAASSRKAGSGVGLLVASAAALGPALIPIGAVGIGAFAGMAGAAGTAALAFAGARREIANNTTVGKQFQAGIDTLTGHLHALEATAAAGVLSGFTDAVKALAPLMPAVGRDVAYMSTQLGQIMRSVLPGVVALFHQANPLFQTFGDEAVKGAQAFNRWATSSTSVSTLVGYIETQLPVVEHTLAQVAEAAGRIITALAPLGSASLSSIGLLARAINEIPMSTLQILAPTIVAAVVAFKGFSAASSAASSLSTFASSLSAAGGASGKLGGLLGVASSGLRGLGIAGLVAVPIIGGLVSILGRQQAAQAAARAEVDSYTQALLASNGAIDANVKQMIAKNLSDKGAFDAAARLGISQKTLTDALLGSESALARVNSATSKAADGIAKYGNNYHSLPKDAQDTRDAIDKVTGSLVTQSGELTGAAKRQRDIALATGQASAAARQQDATASALAARLGTNATAYQAAATAATNQAAAEAKATLQMQLENDAAGLLTQALDKLNGRSLSIADAQNSFLDSLQSVREAAKQNGASLDNLTTKGRANQEAFLAAIHSAQNYAEAQAKSGASSRQASADYERTSRSCASRPCSRA